MKSPAMEKPRELATDCLYPCDKLSVSQGYPASRNFKITYNENGQGSAVVAMLDLQRIRRICKVSGQLLSARGPHTHQLIPGIHVYDPFFSGLLAHSCDPNVFLDMSELWLWSLQDITKGTLLCMDYASTEDELFHQFACRCGSAECRGWITGYNESPNAEGLLFMQHWRRHSLC
ncbi:lysine methyltransferase [Pseudomonas fluorescens]|uniref:Post-SET domain-containing protein n=1 Tax=Pseudomonas fluorescens TaxID=294 RepID=A0A5E7FYG5_PSEFL|nr:lysine methyltransferase [Pseudomonas fluorescens]VVO44811.1 hypothetical protein PS723_06440 [Pseudomonas fluorescens]